MSRTAIITGITGQDGSYLAELLQNRGYTVHGISPDHNYEHVPAGVALHYGDLSDGSNFLELLELIRPQEVYNLAAQSHVRMSFELPVLTANVTAVGVTRLLEAIRLHQLRSGSRVRFFQASSSEMFAMTEGARITEQTPFHPRSPYACAKLYAYWQTVNYREARGMFCVNGLLFNHESPRRGEQFVTRKITRAAGRIKVGLQDKLLLGNIDSRRDWGYARDYVDAMWRMLQLDTPEDLVIATGETHTVREFVQEVFSSLDLDWREHVEIDPNLYRPNEVDVVCGDPSRAKQVLGWEPTVSFQELARLMAAADLERAQREAGLDHRQVYQ